MKRRTSLLVPACFLCSLLFLAYTSVQASSLSELREQQEAAETEAKELEAAKKDLEENLKDLNSELYTLSSSLAEIEEETADLQEKIEEAEDALQDAEELKAQQYSDMKLRIQFMYENGEESVWEMLMGSSSFSDFLNKAEYVQAISNYDRDQIQAYQDNLEAIEAYKQELEEKEAQLILAKEEAQSRQQELETAITTTRKRVDAADSALEDQQAEAAELEKKIAAMEEYERKLEEQRAREEAARLKEQKRQEEIKRQEEELKKQKEEYKQQEGETAENQGIPVDASDNEEYLLACIIDCEAGGESYEAQLAVGSVVLNRVNSSYFADTITGVIYQKGQFSPAASGRLALKLERGPTESCRNAAREVLSGHITGNWLYFRLDNGIIEGTVIGKQVFY